MNAPDNIYVQPCTEIVLRGITSVMATVEKAETDDAIEYTRSDIHAAVVAERDELRREVEQLRARLDAAMEWVPVAEADLQDGEKVDVMQTDPRFHRHNCIYRQSSNDFMLPNGIDLYLPASMSSHIMRIKPPAARGG